MSVTTVIDTGQRPSALPQNWQPKMNQPSPASASEKFPTMDDESLEESKEEPSHLPTTSLRYSREGSWQPRQKGSISRGLPGGQRHRSRKSISEAIGSFRTRGTSVSANAQELAEALKAPVSYRLIGLCVLWYMTSALTNTSSKSILTALPKPITLTIVQFGFVSTWCLILSYLASIFPSLKTAIPALKDGLRAPSYNVLRGALPLAVFQLAGHILSSMATSQIPVSLVHTIKGLSPLFTVLAYRFLFRIRYARATYLSLIPLTLGVMLACSAGFSTNFFGILCAFSAALVFVTQNIFSKKIFNEAARAEAEGLSGDNRKLDKLNLLCYCSGLAFILTAPIWFLSEGYPLLMDLLSDGTIDLSGRHGALDHGPLMLEFMFNGVFHFAQNILAFVLLSMISPVTYSVASLIKRVFVIVVAVVWFGSTTTPIQGFGICLTFLGLYLYDRNKQDDVADRRANADRFRGGRDTLLPLNTNTSKPWNSNGYAFPPPARASQLEKPDGAVLPPIDTTKKEDDDPNRIPKTDNKSRSWLTPGTKQESTWQPGDSKPSD